MKFRTKVVVCMISILSIIFGAGSSALILNSFNSALDREKKSAIQSYEMILNTLKVVNGVEAWADSKDISNTIKEMSTQRNTSWAGIHIYTEKKELYKDGKMKDKSGSLLESTKSKKNVDEKSCITKVIAGNDKEKYLKVSGALKVGKEKCYLDVAYDISPIYEERDKLQQIYYEVFAIMIALCGILSYSNSFIMTRPLVRLSRTSKAIAAGNISYRSRIKTKDEIGTMAREFDKMADKLENNIIELKDTMESQNQFIGNFTHELKTPMTSIIGYADLLRSQALTMDEQVEAANYIFSEGKRLERLSLKLLDIFVTENSEVKLVLVSPGKIVEQLVENLKADYLKRNITLKYNYEKGVCLLEPDLVRSLIINLMDNSRKAMTDNGHGIISVEVKMTDSGCSIIVKDNGKGMPPEALQHITEAFYRVDKSRSRKQGGAGLGLALCAKIVEVHNGDIKFESKENEGTTVTVELKGGRA